MRRLVMWAGLDGWRAEVADVDLGPRGVSAGGTQLGVDPVAYRLDYRLEAGEGFVTRGLSVEATGEGWARRLRLSHDGAGAWSCEADEEGDPPLPPIGGEVEAVGGALDCDLAFSPLTNLIPVRSHGLHERPGAANFLMAWVSVPDLGVHPSRQRYEHVRSDAHEAVVRYVGAHRGFVGELELDGDGLVRVYRELARRVEPPAAGRAVEVPPTGHRESLGTARQAASGDA